MGIARSYPVLESFLELKFPNKYVVVAFEPETSEPEYTQQSKEYILKLVEEVNDGSSIEVNYLENNHVFFVFSEKDEAKKFFERMKVPYTPLAELYHIGHEVSMIDKNYNKLSWETLRKVQ